MESFPYNLWKRINKDIINEDNRDILQIGHSQGDYNLREVISDYLRYSRGGKGRSRKNSYWCRNGIFNSKYY